MTYVLRHALATLDEVRVETAYAEWSQTAEAEKLIRNAESNLAMAVAINNLFSKPTSAVENIIKTYPVELLYHLGRKHQWMKSEFALPVVHTLPLYLREKMLQQMPSPEVMVQHARVDSPSWMFKHAEERGWMDGQEPQLLVACIKAGHASDEEMLSWLASGFVRWTDLALSKRMSAEIAEQVLNSGDVAAVLCIMQTHPGMLSPEDAELVRAGHLDAPGTQTKAVKQIALEMKNVASEAGTRHAMLFSHDATQLCAALMAWHTWETLCQITDTSLYAHLRHDGWGDSVPSNFAQHVLRHPDKWVRARAASLDKLSDEARSLLLLDRSYEVRIRVATRVDLTEEQFMVLAFDRSAEVRQAVCRNLSMPLTAYLLTEVKKEEQKKFSNLRRYRGEKNLDTWLVEHMPTLDGFPLAMVDAAFPVLLKQLQEAQRPVVAQLRERMKQGLVASTR